MSTVPRKRVYEHAQLKLQFIHRAFLLLLLMKQRGEFERFNETLYRHLVFCFARKCNKIISQMRYVYTSVYV